MTAPDISSTDDELYAWLVASLDVEGQRTRDAGDGVIEVLLDDEEGVTRRVEVLLTREQVREWAWTEYDVYDDTDLDVVPRTDDPVRTGIRDLAQDADETLATMWPGEEYVVFYQGRFRASVRRERPPVRAEREEVAPIPGGEWHAYPPGDPRSARTDASFAGFLAAEEELERLLASMEPVLQPGRWVFATVDTVPESAQPVVTVREAEGVTVVLEQEAADGAGLAYDFVAAMITLQVRSSLAAVGLTAAVSRELTDHGISANVVAGCFHDHLFVPVDRGQEALDLLTALSRGR